MGRVHLILSPLLLVLATGCDKAHSFCRNAVEHGPYVDDNGFDRCMERYRAASPAARACFEGCKNAATRSTFETYEDRCNAKPGEETRALTI